MIKNLLTRFALSALLLVAAAAALTTQPVLAAEWYEGGTLHTATGLEWQQGSREDKLATAADLVAHAHSKNMLNPELASSIKGVDSYFPMANALTKELDAYFKPLPDPEENRATYANQKVNSIAALLMAISGWLE